MNKLILIFILVFSVSSWANDVENRRKQILQIIDQEISEVDRLMRSNKNNPHNMLRKAELYLEKARLWRESENQRYLAIPTNKRKKLRKKDFFKNSNKYFSVANSICERIARKYPRFSKIGDVYYILGFNAKEANKQKSAAKYLERASKNSKSTVDKAKVDITLAEVYYNRKKYARAVPLYERSLRKTENSKWWTKDAFNLAWCYYQTNRYKDAISLMRKVHVRSKNKKYIDMRNEVERDVGVFYATSGKIKEGIAFFEKIGVNFTSRLMLISKNLLEQGQFLRADNVLSHALKYEKNDKKRIEIYVEKLILYGRELKMKSHQQTAKILFSHYKKGNLTSSQTKVLQFQIEKLAATLQRQVIAKTYRRLPKIRKAKAAQAILYFEMLSVIDQKRADEFKFLKGETAFAAKMNKDAYRYYKDSFTYSEKNKRTKFLSKSMDGLLITLTRKENKSINNNIFAFEGFLRNWKKSQKAKGIYTRLFNNYMTKKDPVKAKTVLDRYRVHFSKDYKTQEAMIAKLMDVDRKKKDNNAIRAWINKIDQGVYVVSPKFKIKLKELLTTIQIEDVQKQLNSGNKKVALVGYLNILKDPYSTKRSKINAKYNLSALYFELNDPANAYKWSIEALKEMETKDVKQFAGSFITIANFLFTSLEYKRSANLSENFIYKICSIRHKKKDVSFRNSVFIYLADGDIASAERVIGKAKKCKIGARTIALAEYEILREYRKQQNWSRHEFYTQKLATSKYYRAKMIDEYLFLVKLHTKFSNMDKVAIYKKKAWDLYYKAKKNKESISMGSLDYFSGFAVQKMESTAKQIHAIKYSFPEKVFATRQQKKLSLLEKLTTQASEVQAIGSGVGIVNSFKLLHDTYLQVAKDLFAFVPANKSKEYISAFKKDMNKLGEQIKQAALQYKKEAKKAISNNAILNTNNFYFQDTPVPIKYFGGNSSLLMDRGGKQ